MSATTTKDTELVYVPFPEYASGLPMVDDLSKAKAVGVSDTGEACRVSLDVLGGVASDIDTLKRKTDTNARNISTNTADIYTLKTKVADLSDAELPKQNARDIVQLKGDVALINAGQRTQDTKIANNTTAATEARVSAQNADRKADKAVQKTEELRSYVDELASRIEKGVRQVPNMADYVALVGEIVQYVGDTDSTYEHGGFYEWNGSAWVRVRVDARYKAGKDIEITEDGTINATFDHSPIEAEIKAVADDLTAHKTAQATKDKAQDDATKANTDAIATLNGGEQTSGSVKNTVLDYIGKAQHARFKVVQTLPPVKDAESNVLYLVPFEGKEGVYKQYILADGRFVQLDNTEVDLSDYYTKHETDTAISDVADALTAKDTEQDGRISALESKPSPTTQCVPYSANLNAVTDDLGVAWMNTSKTDTSKEYGHLYKFKEGEVVVKYYEYYAVVPSKEEQGQDIKIEPGFYIPWRERTRRYPCWMYSRSGGYSKSVYGAPYDILSVGSLVWDWNIEGYVKVTAKDTASETFTAVSDSGTSYTYGGGKEYSAANYSTTLYCKTTNTKIHLNGWGTMPIFEHDGVFDLDYTANSRGNPNFSEFVKQATKDIVDEGGWVDVYHDFDPSELSKVAKSGDYNDLSNKPAIPSAQVNSDWNATTGVAQILNKPNLAKVATSGSYNDLTDKPTPPSPTSQCVPYSDNLDGITDDKGVAWMNVGEGREFGHLYRKEQGGESIVIPARTYYITLPEGNATGLPAGKYYKTEEWFNGDLWYTNQSPYYYGNNNEKVGDKVWDGYGNYYAVTSINYPFLTLDNGSEIWLQHGASGGGAYRYIHESGKYDLWYVGDQTLPENWISSKDMRGFGQKRTTASGTEYVEWLGPVCTPYSDPSDMQRTTAEVIIGGSTWKDVYDTSAITADITAEVQRATQAESALGTRINTKADVSTWSANLKTQIDTDHTTLSGLSSKWTEILYSQIDADHKTLGNLNTYLSEAKRTSIDDAIAKAHQQNTDTSLAVDRVKWNGATNYLETTGGVYALNEVRSNNGVHTLSQKLNANMLRPYATTEDMLADMANIPNGAWCAIINTHSAGVSAQSDDDYLL